MKLAVLNEKAENVGDIELTQQFTEAYHPNLIGRAVHSLQSRARQAYGTSPDAGMRHSSELSKRRRKYRGCYGFGISRVNRKIMTRRGRRFFWVGAQTAQTRGGRRAHAPLTEKKWAKKINKKENRLAIRSAMSVVMQPELVGDRGHIVPESYPFVLASSVQNLEKTKDVQAMFNKLGFEAELNRASERKIRAGKGKMRGRRYRTKKSVLLVVSDNCKLAQSASNLRGVDVVNVRSLNAEVLAPGADAGRATLFTDASIEILKNEGLYC